MSEEYKNKNEERLTNEWDILAEDINWLEEQAKKGDEATREKAKKHIQENIALMTKVLNEIDEIPAEETPKEAIKAREAIADEQKDQSKQYERDIPNGDGTMNHIVAVSDEDLQEKIRQHYEDERERYTR